MHITLVKSKIRSIEIIEKDIVVDDYENNNLIVNILESKYDYIYIII